MQQNWKFRRGDIYYVQFGNTSTGSEQHGDRPAVIIQNDVGNTYAPTLIVVPLTSNTEKKVTQPTHCLLENEGLSMSSMALAEQIFTIDKSRILKYLGHLAPEDMQRLDYALKNSLALNPLGSIRKLKPIIRSTAAYTGLTMQQEALFFAEQNGHAAPLTAGIKLRAKVVGEDALSMAFLAATNRVGLDFNYDSLQLSDYRISCVGTALKLYNQMGEKIYCEALRLIVDAWEGKPDSFRAAVLKGVMYFVEVYHGEFNEERLIRALRSVHPMEIYRTGMDNPAKLPGWKKYVFPIYAAYNGKSRKDALPMKF